MRGELENLCERTAPSSTTRQTGSASRSSLGNGASPPPARPQPREASFRDGCRRPVKGSLAPRWVVCGQVAIRGSPSMNASWPIISPGSQVRKQHLVLGMASVICSCVRRAGAWALGRSVAPSPEAETGSAVIHIWTGVSAMVFDLGMSDPPADDFPNGDLALVLLVGGGGDGDVALAYAPAGVELAERTPRTRRTRLRLHRACTRVAAGVERGCDHRG